MRIASEEALIVWDAERKTEHFVRRASFRSTSHSFGFLVPTPSKPELAEVEETLFDQLRTFLRPREEIRREGWTVEPTALLLTFARGVEKSAEAPMLEAPVRVLEEVSVAGYDAVILEADDPSALAKWLQQNGYASGPSLSEWLAPYVQQRWKLSAFKVAANATKPGVHALASKAVRMSFTTERPFFPYREPADQRETLPAALQSGSDPGRDLRVYFVSTERAQGTLGSAGVWPGKTLFAQPFENRSLECVGAGLGRSDQRPTSYCIDVPLPASPWLTVFEDSSSPRPGTDEVYFAASSDSSKVAVPPLIRNEPRVIPIPLDLLALCAIVVAVIALRGSARERS